MVLGVKGFCRLWSTYHKYHKTSHNHILECKRCSAEKCVQWRPNRKLSSNSLVPLSFIEHHGDFQLIHFDFPTHHFTILIHSHCSWGIIFHCSMKRCSVTKALINPLYTTCSAPNCSQTQWKASWWALWSIGQLTRQIFPLRVGLTPEREWKESMCLDRWLDWTPLQIKDNVK